MKRPIVNEDNQVFYNKDRISNEYKHKQYQIKSVLILLPLIILSVMYTTTVCRYPYFLHNRSYLTNYISAFTCSRDKCHTPKYTAWHLFWNVIVDDINYWHYQNINEHYIDVIMTTMASQITSLTVVYWTVYSDADQGKHKISAPLARTKGQLRGKCFHLVTSSWIAYPWNHNIA